MPTSSDFYSFAGGVGANAMTQADYAAAVALRSNGFSSGTAQSLQLNKVWRQSSIMAAVLAQFIANVTGVPSVDDGTTATLLSNLTKSIQNSKPKFLAVTGTNTLAAVATPTLTAYAAGQTFNFIAQNTSSGTATLNIDGLGAKPLTKQGTNPLTAGDLQAGRVYTVILDALGNFQLTAGADIPLPLPVNQGGTGSTTGDSLLPAGMVAHFAMNSAPAGWLVADGQNVSRAAYPALFAAIGTTYGAGDGVTTFTLPDLRGEFLRGLDRGRGVDPGRAIGTAQSDALKSHSHTYSFTVGDNNNDYSSMPAASNGAGLHTFSSATAATGSTETHPRNVAVLACIKY